MLGLGGGPTDELIVQLGCDLAQVHGAELVAVHVVEVDWRHSLGDDLSSARERATTILDVAEGTAERARVRMRSTLLQARDVGAALVDEAAELGADVLVVGLPYRKKFGGDFAIGQVVPYVFQNAPCSVIVAREPVAVAAARDKDPRKG